VDVNYRLFIRNFVTNDVAELQETHTMRYFFKTEIDIISAQTEFRCQHSEEWLSGKAIGCDTWGVCFVLKTALYTTKTDES
jgi:hypothetical protein